jgi:ribonuclease HI
MPRSKENPRGGRLFGEPTPEAKPAAYRANIDGGSRGNPGPASYGIVIRDPKGEIIARLKKYIGRTTNNVAEYYGLIAALDYVHSNNIRALRVESDSELLVNQMRGKYKVKSDDLKPLFERAKKMSQALSSFRIDHVYREQNTEADALANEALDETAGAPSKPKPAFFNGQKLSSSDLEGEQNSYRAARAKYRRGVLHLLESLDLPDDTDVEILFRPIKKP